MRLLIVGGRLQGTEAAYLAAKAGWETILVDRREDVPAAALADRVVVADLATDEQLCRRLVSTCDAVLPACEDTETLAWLDSQAPRWDAPLLFDLAAYRVSASKLASAELFDRLGVARPRPWPACGLPAVVKPDGASGSEGVTVARDEQTLEAARRELAAAGHDCVVEEFVEGPSLSLEVLCWGDVAVPLQVTGLEFDDVYDCKRVVAPLEGWDARVTPVVTERFDRATATLAAGLGLRGLMDVEVMVRGDGQPAVLEIDARLPSQTPTAVLWSSGLNIVEALYETARRGAPPQADRAPRRAVVYEHVHAHDGVLEVAGEHVMAAAGPLALLPGFFGADEALTDYGHGASSWSATLICTDATTPGALSRAAAVVAALARQERLEVRPGTEEARS